MGSADERRPQADSVFLVTPADETSAAFSPDGKWVVYSSDESGQAEVYVQEFLPGHVPAAGVGKWQISTAGGDKPRWRHDGKEIYYIAPDGKMIAVPVTATATSFQPGVAIPLFQTHTRGYVPYDVAAEGLSDQHGYRRGHRQFDSHHGGTELVDFVEEVDERTRRPRLGAGPVHCFSATCEFVRRLPGHAPALQSWVHAPDDPRRKGCAWQPALAYRG